MRHLLALVLVLAAWTLPVAAENDAERAAIQTVIINQIEAFRRDDSASAYSHAAPAIRAAFPTPESFMAMVRQGYRSVYRPQSFEFGPLDHSDGEWVQPVRLIGPDGASSIAIYWMERQPDGAWKIAGVYLLPGKDRSA